MVEAAIPLHDSARVEAGDGAAADDGAIAQVGRGLPLHVVQSAFQRIHWRVAGGVSTGLAHSVMLPRRRLWPGPGFGVQASAHLENKVSATA